MNWLGLAFSVDGFEEVSAGNASDNEATRYNSLRMRSPGGSNIISQQADLFHTRL